VPSQKELLRVSSSLQSKVTATCTFCNGVSSITLTGVDDELEVLCPRCGTYLGNVGTLKQTDAGEVAAERAAVAEKSAR
jgi:phage FluMu protein Com